MTVTLHGHVWSSSQHGGQYRASLMLPSLSHRLIYKCSMCDTVFTQQSLLYSHFDQHLATQRVSVFKCPDCSMHFAQKQLMLDHIKVGVPVRSPRAQSYKKTALAVTARKKNNLFKADMIGLTFPPTDGWLPNSSSRFVGNLKLFFDLSVFLIISIWHWNRSLTSNNVTASASAV